MWARPIFLLLGADAVLGLASALTMGSALQLLMETFHQSHYMTTLAIGAMGTAASLFGLVCAWAVDRLTTLWLPLGAAVCSLMLRVALATLTLLDRPPESVGAWAMALLGLLMAVEGVLVGQPLVLYLNGQIERQSTSGKKKEANAALHARIFAWRYGLNNAAIFGVSLCYDLLRTYAPSVSDANAVVQWASVGASLVLVAVLLVALVDAPSVPLRPHLVEEAQQPLAGQLRGLFKDASLWRFMAMCVLLLSTSSIFRHIEQTLPPVMQRLYDARVHFALVQAINPLLIIFLAPLIQGVVGDKAGYWVIAGGTAVTSASLLPLVLGGIGAAPKHGPATSFWDYAPYVVFMAIFSLGEALWSARFTPFALSAAPNDKKALYNAIAGIPSLVARPFAAWHSAWLVRRYCPSDVACSPVPLWGTVGGISLIAPLALTVFNRWLDPVRQRDVFVT
jgi:hypothetical protein